MTSTITWADEYEFEKRVLQNPIEAMVNTLKEKLTLEVVAEWVGENLDPDAVFTEDQIKQFVQNNMTPSDIWTEEELREFLDGE